MIVFSGDLRRHRPPCPWWQRMVISLLHSVQIRMLLFMPVFYLDRFQTRNPHSSTKRSAMCGGSRTSDSLSFCVPVKKLQSFSYDCAKVVKAAVRVPYYKMHISSTLLKVRVACALSIIFSNIWLFHLLNWPNRDNRAGCPGLDRFVYCYRLIHYKSVCSLMGGLQVGNRVPNRPLGYFENSYIPENQRTPKPRLKNAEIQVRSQKKIPKKRLSFFQKLCICEKKKKMHMCTFFFVSKTFKYLKFIGRVLMLYTIRVEAEFAEEKVIGRVLMLCSIRVEAEFAEESTEAITTTTSS
ncbi:hypothetical protein LXL04_003934 [Taraxacum kok-saghyz]